MTPLQKSKEPINADPESYNIANVKSDDDTDDECDPKNPIPIWAQSKYPDCTNS